MMIRALLIIINFRCLSNTLYTVRDAVADHTKMDGAWGRLGDICVDTTIHIHIPLVPL